MTRRRQAARDQPDASQSSSSASPASQEGPRTRGSSTAAEFPVQAHVIENASNSGGPVVVLHRPNDATFQATVAPLPVQDRSLALVTVNNQGNQAVIASGHAPYQGATAHAFMNDAARAAQGRANVLMLDTNLYDAPRQHREDERPRSGIGAWHETPVGGTTRG
ncbi:MAG: hypothetical protein WB755_16115, partial [Terriglobales bacterium]